jgi:hypothetical protein
VFEALSPFPTALLFGGIIFGGIKGHSRLIDSFQEVLRSTADRSHRSACRHEYQAHAGAERFRFMAKGDEALADQVRPALVDSPQARLRSPD